MYLKVKGSTRRIIQDMYEVWLPPKPKRHQILFADLRKEDQFWRRPKPPADWEERRAEELIHQRKEMDLVEQGFMTKIKYFDPVLERYRRQEWMRRIYGIWFMNDGVPTYITGLHYWYLTHCKLDHQENDGYPLYYEPQLDRFYFRELCMQDPFCHGYLIVGPRGTGKCLGRGTKVRMYHGGMKNVEDVVVGDLLMGPDSTPRTVSKLHRGYDEMYEVVQNAAMNYVCNSQHIVSLRRNKGWDKITKRKGNVKRPYPQYSQVANVPIHELLNKSQTFFNGFSGYKVGVEYEQKPVSLDPYFLGLWLGDGTSAGPFITSMDQEIVDEITKYSNSLGLSVVRRDHNPEKNKASCYSIVSTEYRTSPNKILDLLRENKVLNNKHIPDNYIYNTRDVRLKLLAGLIDTDGHLNSNVYEITQVREHLARQIKLVADTLGYKTSIKVKITNGVNYYRVSISGHNGEIPVVLPRKKCTPKPNKDHRLTRINEIKPLGIGEYFGFELDGDRLFLLEDGTVTHNTAEEVAAQLENMTKPPHDRFAAIQSKTEDDAKTVIFQEKMVPMFNMLLDFWKPEFSHGTEPKDKFIFKRKSDRSKNARDVKHGPQYELGNTILCYPPQNKVLDGKTLSDIINDEIGKLKPETEMDAYTRNGVNARTVFRNKVKRGLIRATTTVEEMEAGGDECLEIWQESDPTMRDGNGFTLSKLYRFFISALDTQNDLADKHGRIPLDKAMAVIDNERAPFKGQPEKLTPLMRKNPKTAEEAFIKDQSKTLFDTIILSNRTSELEALKRKGQLPGRCYTPTWRNGVVDSEVEMIENEYGRVRLFFHPDEIDKTTKRKILNATNSYKDPHDGKTKFKPVNNHLWRIGVDPIRTVKTDDPRASQMAAYGYMPYNVDLDFNNSKENYISDNILFEYCHRDTDPEINYEEVIMMMRWLGCSALVEQNAGEFNKHLRSRGYERFLIYRKNFSKEILDNRHTKNSQSGENPVHSTVEVIESYVKRIAAKIKRSGMRINSLPLLYQLSAFDPKKPTKYDLVVAYGYALLAVEATLEDEDEYERMTDDVIEVFDRYDISGNQSKLMPSKYNSGETDDFENDFDNPNYVETLLYGPT